MTCLFLMFPLILAAAGNPRKILDLTHTHGYGAISSPASAKFKMENVLKWNLSEGVVAEANIFTSAEHSGTHVDAPLHFCPQGLTIDKIPAEKLSGPGVVFDLRTEAENDWDFEVTQKTFEDWERVNGRIPDGAVVLFNFGWARFWPNVSLIYNSETMEAGTYHFPGLSTAGSKWLTTNRNVIAVGTDTPSIDNGLTTTWSTHVNLLCDHALIIPENVANLNKMPTTGSIVYLSPLKLEHGTGSPTRIFAVIDPETSGSSDRFLNPALLILLLLSAITVYYCMRNQ